MQRVMRQSGEVRSLRNPVVVYDSRGSCATIYTAEGCINRKWAKLNFFPPAIRLKYCNFLRQAALVPKGQRRSSRNPLPANALR